MYGFSKRWIIREQQVKFPIVIIVLGGNKGHVLMNGGGQTVWGMGTKEIFVVIKLR